MKDKVLLIALLLILSFAFMGCAHTEDVKDCVTGHTYGFWGGLWHGIIAIPDFIAMLIWPGKFTVYAPNNNGGWYAFGFLLGISIEITGIYKASN